MAAEPAVAVHAHDMAPPNHAESWFKKYGTFVAGEHIENGELIDQHRSWCESNQAQAGAEAFMNGVKLPEALSLWHLRYFFDQIRKSNVIPLPVQEESVVQYPSKAGDLKSESPLTEPHEINHEDRAAQISGP